MRPITGADITDFYTSRTDLLVLTAAGEFNHIDRSDLDLSPDDDGTHGTHGTAYDYVTTHDGDEVQVLLERSTITDGDWFPDALNDDGDLDPTAAQEMAGIINQDGILDSRALAAVHLGKQWKAAEAEANRIALKRARKVAEVVAYCGGNQSEAGRILGLDQSTVNKLVKKAKAAQTA